MIKRPPPLSQENRGKPPLGTKMAKIKWGGPLSPLSFVLGVSPRLNGNVLAPVRPCAEPSALSSVHRNTRAAPFDISVLHACPKMEALQIINLGRDVPTPSPVPCFLRWTTHCVPAASHFLFSCVVQQRWTCPSTRGNSTNLINPKRMPGLSYPMDPRLPCPVSPTIAQLTPPPPKASVPISLHPFECYAAVPSLICHTAAA